MTKFIHSDYRKIYDSGATMSEISLYFRIAIAAGSENCCRVSVPALAKWMNSTVAWVRKSTGRLEALGYITIERSNGGSGITNTYRINTVAETPVSKKSVDKSKNTCSESAKTVIPEMPHKEDNINKTENKTSEKTRPAHTSCAEKFSSPLFTSYPVQPEEILQRFPESSYDVAVNYIFRRTSTNWHKKSGHKILPREISDDFACWLKRERSGPPEPMQEGNIDYAASAWEDYLI